jgi:dipeptidyl aminopeptidase/acylaminoacyl peptidase
MAGIFAPAQNMPSIDQLFTRPYVWGTQPSALEWSKNGQVLFFLWNSEGRRFRDLYAWHTGTKKLVRLTDLESQKNDLNLTADERDERLKQYLPPEPGVAAFSVSDDGKRAAFAYKGDLYLAAADASKPVLRLTRTKATESSPELSPDGAQLASFRGGQIVVLDIGTGQIWQAADVEGGSITRYEWSPDGKSFVYRVRKGTPRQLPLPNYSGRVVTARNIIRSLPGDEPSEVSLFVVPAQGGKPRPIDRINDKAQIIDVKWSPDSKKLLIAQSESDWKKRQIGVVDHAATKLRIIFEETDPRWVEDGFTGWSPDSSTLFFTSEKDGRAHLYTVKAEGGAPAQLTRGAFEIRSETFSQDPQWVGDWIYYSSTEDSTAQRHFYRISADGLRKQKLSSGGGLHIGVVSEDGRNTAMLRADEKSPFDIWVNEQRVTRSPLDAFHSIPWPQVKYVHFPSRIDRKPVAAKILLPPGYRPEDNTQKPRPAVVYIHGAGIATSVLEQWGSYNELRYVFNAFLTSRGYVVIDIDYRGSTGYGRDWRSDIYLHMGGKDLEDVLGGVDYLKTLGNIDMKRVGIWGVSYGGFMTAMAMFQSPGAFRAGASWASVNDWENYNAGYTVQRLSTPEKHPEAYRRSSPIHFSNRLEDKLLIVHGMVDDNVLFQDAVQLTEKLVKERKDFAHIFYPEESHGFVRDETWIDAFRRTADWFGRYLQ